MAHTVIRVRFLEALLGTLIGPASARGIPEQSGICRVTGGTLDAAAAPLTGRRLGEQLGGFSRPFPRETWRPNPSRKYDPLALSSGQDCLDVKN
jgi:hypothetical protein